MLEPISQSTKALYDTVIARLEGLRPLMDVSEFYGIDFIESYHKPSWRSALDVAALGHRGTYGTLYMFIREATKSLDESYSFQVQNPYSLLKTGGAPTNDWLGRLLELNKVPYFVTKLNGNTVELAEMSTGHWVGADLTVQIGAAGTAVDGNLLPFQIVEPTPGNEITSSCLPIQGSNFLQANKPLPDKLISALMDACKVYIHFTASTGLVPATYLQPAGGGARPANQPFGGHVQEDESKDGFPTKPTGPMPPYLYEGSGAFAVLVDRLATLVAAGVVPYSRFKKPE